MAEEGIEKLPLMVVLLPLGKIIGRYEKDGGGCVIHNPRQLLSQQGTQNAGVIEFKVLKLFEEPIEMAIKDVGIMYDVSNPYVVSAYQESVTGIKQATLKDMMDLLPKAGENAARN